MSEPVPTDRELEALKVLWKQGEATVREVCEAINAKGEKLAYTTVLSLLQVMEQKGLAGHRPIGKAYAYFPKVHRDRTFGRLAKGFLDRVFDGALDAYVLHAIPSDSLTAEELDRLKQTLADAESNAERRRRKGDPQ